MKNTKKLVALVVAILMLATFVTSTLPVFAETSSSSRYTVKVEGEEPIYEGSLLNKAAEAAVANSGAAVYLNEDVELSELTQDERLLDVGSNQALVIDGNGHSLTAGGRGYFIRFNNVSNASVTFRNFDTLTLQATATDIGIHGSNITVNFEDITTLTFDGSANTANQLYGVGPVSEVTNAVVNFKNITTVSAVEKSAVVYTKNGKIAVNVTNVSGIVHNHPDSTTGEAGFAGFIANGSAAEIELTLVKSHIIEESGYGVAFKGAVTAAGGAKATVNVDGESSITTKKKEGTCVWVQGASTVNLNLAENAQLITNSSSSAGAFVGKFEVTAGSAKLNIVDNGAVYVVGAEQTSTVTFPEGEDIYMEQLATGSTATAKVVAAGESFTNDTGAAVTFKKVSLAGAFANVLGASIRTEAPYGIRFAARMDKSLYDMLKAQGATFGIVIAPYKYVEGFENTFFNKVTTGDQVKSYYADVVCENVTVNGDVVEFRAAVYIAGNENLTGATKAQLMAKMCACAYYTVDSVTTWADFSATDNVRSIYDVAKAHYEAGNTDNATINGILTTCEYFQAQ